MCCTFSHPLLWGPELEPGGRLLQFSGGCGWSKCPFVRHRARQYVNALSLPAQRHAAHQTSCVKEDLVEPFLGAASLPALEAYCTALSPCGWMLLFAVGTVQRSGNGQTSLLAALGMTSPSEGWAKP